MDLQRLVSQVVNELIPERGNIDVSGTTWETLRLPQGHDKPSQAEFNTRLQEVIHEYYSSKFRLYRNSYLDSTDKYATIDYPHINLTEQQKWLDHRQEVRDLPALISANSFTDLNEFRVWVINQGGSLKIGDKLKLSNIAGYFVKGEPSAITLLENCDFSPSMNINMYYSNIVDITEKTIYSNVTVSEYANLSIEQQTNYVECNYYSSNTVSYYSNVITYDNGELYSNISVERYNNEPPEIQAIYTPVLKYSNVYETEKPHRYVKVITHYSNISLSNVITYSNINEEDYNNLITVTPSYTYFSRTDENGMEDNISLEAYGNLSEERRSLYTSQIQPSVTSNLQPNYTRQSVPIPDKIKNITVDGVEFTAVNVKCRFQ